MMQLKHDTFCYGDEQLVLRELTALQHVEYLRYAAAHPPPDADAGLSGMAYLAEMNNLNCQINALLVAMSLASNAPTQTAEERAESQQQLMATWPAQLLAEAAQRVLALSQLLDEGPPEEASERPDAAKP
ncbi:hypothetical protein NMD70_08620 [Edwardsiella tarda]|uniref:phage minor tail protein domain-containing protein n=2 Tax=Edwardsiella tarda TaxID=636 RepID=UPI00351C433C